MWKIGPECAAQQAKWASASAGTAACAAPAPAVMRGASAARPASRRRARRALGTTGGAADQQRGRDQQHPGDDADRQHRGAPVVGRDQPARERRHRQRRHAHAGGDQRRPRGCGCCRTSRVAAAIIGAKKAPAATPTSMPNSELELGQASWRGSRATRPSPSSTRARSARRCACRSGRSAAPQPKAGDAHGQEIEGHGASRCRCATSRCRPTSAAGRPPARTSRRWRRRSSARRRRRSPSHRHGRLPVSCPSPPRRVMLLAVLLIIAAGRS